MPTHPLRRVALALSLIGALVGPVPAARAISDVYAVGMLTATRGSVDGSGTIIGKMRAPAAPFTRYVKAEVDGKLMAATVLHAEGDGDASLANLEPNVAYSGDDILTVSVERVKDGTHTVVFIVTQPSGVELFRSSSPPVTISENTKMRLDYTIKLGAVDAAARKATLTVTYPEDTFARTLTLTTSYNPDVSCKGAIAKCVATLPLGSYGIIYCATQLMKMQCPGATVVTKTIGVKGGSANFDVPKQPPVPSPGSYTTLLVATDINDAVLARQSFDYQIGGADQMGKCSAKVTKTDLPGSRAFVDYDYTEIKPLLNFDGVLKAELFLDGVSYMKFNLNRDANQVPIEVKGLTNHNRVYKVRIVLSDTLDKCINSFDIDMKDTSVAENGGPDTPQTEHTPFTWLSGKCIFMAEKMDLGAVACVISDTIDLALSLVGILSTGLVIYGGFVLGTAVDDAGRAKGKKIITMALAGLVVVLLAFVITQVLLGGGIF